MFAVDVNSFYPETNIKPSIKKVFILIGRNYFDKSVLLIKLLQVVETS